MIKIGAHVSNSGKLMLVGSINEALSYGANALMLYTGAPQNTIRKNINEFRIEEFHTLLKENNIQIEDVIIHAPYIVNLAQPDNEKWNFAINFLTKEVEMTSKIGAKYIVIHPGAFVTSTKEAAIKRIASGINCIIENTIDKNVVITIETMAGKGTECGRSFNEVKEIIDLVHDKTRVGVCLDTCHISDAGYDIISNYEEVVHEFINTVGLEYLKVMHINDSKNITGSKKDRHENFGLGKIGFEPLMKFIYDERFKDIPKILETPYVKDETNPKISYPPYKYEIKMIKEKTMNPNLISDILEQK